jgi:isoaspartyl peptidase/L-asparaginase-like protein (Ntn-hydrolase superfamily)
MMRVLAAKCVCDRIGAGEQAQAAVEAQLGAMAASVGADGGFIALAAHGDVGVAHATASMPHAWRIEGELRATVRMRR